MRRLLVVSCAALAMALPSAAQAWSPLRAENINVKKGNALMAEEKHGPALEAYDAAARELPGERGVQLNRGLALLGQDLTEQSKEAFLAAADPSAPPDVRADAYYDLGIAYAREGDSLAEQESHEEASAHFQEAADAFKRALRVRPGDRNAAWNLEYALRRIREQEEKQARQEQQQQEQQQQERQQQEQQQQEQQQQDDEEQQDQGQEQQPQQQDEQEGQDENQEQGRSPQGETPPEDREQQQQSETGSGDRPEDRPPPMARDDVERFLDALEQNERNLPLERARRRSSGRRPPEKDW